MLEGRDAGCSHSQQYFSVRDRWFWKIDELQPCITTECFRSHCTHMSPPVIVGCSVGLLYYGLTARAEFQSASPGLTRSG